MKRLIITVFCFIALSSVSHFVDASNAAQSVSPTPFELCFNADPTTHDYWPANLVPQGNSSDPYCITQAQDIQTSANSVFENDVSYAVYETLVHVRPNASLTTPPTLKVSMAYDPSGGNCAATAAMSPFTDKNGLTYEVPGTLTLFTTGNDDIARSSNPFNADILLQCSKKSLANFWFDPRPWDRNGDNAEEPGPADQNKGDLVGMQLHEVEHGLGFESNRDPQSGSYDGNLPTKFDTFLRQYISYYPAYNNVMIYYPFEQSFLVDDTNQTFFTGQNALKYLEKQSAPQINTLPGIPIASIATSEPLATQNFSHIGVIKTTLSYDQNNVFDQDCSSTPYREGIYGIFGNDLMTMCYIPIFNQNYGIKNNRMNISDLDYAVLKDLGYNIVI